MEFIDHTNISSVHKFLLIVCQKANMEVHVMVQFQLSGTMTKTLSPISAVSSNFEELKCEF